MNDDDDEESICCCFRRFTACPLGNAQAHKVPKGQFFTFLVVMFSKSWPFLKIVVTFSKSWPHQLTRCPHSVQKFSTFSTGRWWNFFSEKVSEIITLFNSPNNCTNVFPPNFQLSFPFPPQKKLSATNSINNYPIHPLLPKKPIFWNYMFSSSICCLFYAFARNFLCNPFRTHKLTIIFIMIWIEAKVY